MLDQHRQIALPNLADRIGIRQDAAAGQKLLFRKIGLERFAGGLNMLLFRAAGRCFSHGR